MVDPGKLNANNSGSAHANIEAMEDRLSTNLFSYRQTYQAGRGALRIRLEAVLLEAAHVRDTRPNLGGNTVLRHYAVVAGRRTAERRNSSSEEPGGKLGAGTLGVCAGGSDDSDPRHGPRAVPGGCDHQPARLYSRVFRPERRRQAGDTHIPERLSDERVRRPAQLRSAHGAGVPGFGHEHDHVQTTVGQAVHPALLPALLPRRTSASHRHDSAQAAIRAGVGRCRRDIWRNSG